jgi:hypothetical protein
LHRNAEKSLAEVIKTFLAEVEKETGAQLFVLAGYERPNGRVAITRYVILYGVGIFC